MGRRIARRLAPKSGWTYCTKCGGVRECGIDCAGCARRTADLAAAVDDVFADHTFTTLGYSADGIRIDGRAAGVFEPTG